MVDGVDDENQLLRESFNFFEPILQKPIQIIMQPRLNFVLLQVIRFLIHIFNILNLQHVPIHSELIEKAYKKLDRETDNSAQICLIFNETSEQSREFSITPGSARNGSQFLENHQRKKIIFLPGDDDSTNLCGVVLFMVAGRLARRE